MKKRILCLFLTALLVLGCMPILPIFAADEDKVISRYSDAAENFTVTTNSETAKNEAGMSDEDYKAFLRDPATFSISFGDTAWQVGQVTEAGVFTPYTRVLAMIYDNGGKHDTNWASTEEQYERRIDNYVDGTGSVTIWDGQTPLWNIQNDANYKRNGLTTTISSIMTAMLYTAEADCTVNFTVDTLRDLGGHSLAVLVDGKMIWPVEGGALNNPSNFYTLGNLATVESLNAELLAVAGTELKAGQQVAFCVRGSGDSLIISPAIVEYVAGSTAVSLVDPYGEGQIITSAPGEILPLPAYAGVNIFLGWDTDGDGTPDAQAGDNFEVPNKPSVKITACVVESASFRLSYPTYDAATSTVIFHDGWTLGRYDMALGLFEGFVSSNGEHLYVSTGMWGATGGGFYLGNGKIALSGCYDDGPYAVSLRNEVVYSGKVEIDFARLQAMRQLNANEFADTTTEGGHVDAPIAYDFAIYKNDTKIFPADGDWWHFVSEESFSTAQASVSMLEAYEALGKVACDVQAGDTIEFRIRQGHEACWMFYCDPVIRYTELSANPQIESVKVPKEAGEIALDVVVNTLMADEGATNGLLVWTSAQTEYDPATGTALTAYKQDGDRSYFRIDGIEAKKAVDEFFFMPYSASDAGTVYGKVVAYSVKTAAEKELTLLKGEDRAFLVALLNYCAEAQKAFAYKVDTLANSSLNIEESEPSFNTDGLTDSYAQTGEGNKITSVSLISGSKLGFKFMTNGVEGATSYVLEIADNAEFTDSEKIDMVNAEVGAERKAIVYMDGAKADDVFYARVIIDGEAGATLTYSLASYMLRMMDSIDDNIYYLVQSALLLAEAYAD